MKFIRLNAVFKNICNFNKKDDRHLSENLVFHTLNGGTYCEDTLQVFFTLKK